MLQIIIFFLGLLITSAVTAAPHNFGLLVHNSRHTIYRSAELGKSGLEKLTGWLASEGLPFPEVIVSMNHDGYRYLPPFPSHYAIEEYEQAASYGYAFYHAFGYAYRTYLDGENPERPSHNIDRAIYITPAYRAVFGFHDEGKPTGGMDAFYRVLDLVLGTDKPVLFHCTGGMHRTGMVALAIRYIQGGAWLTGDYTRRHFNAAQFEYYQHNRVLIRQANLDFVERWSHSAEFEAYRKRYQDELNAD